MAPNEAKISFEKQESLVNLLEMVKNCDIKAAESSKNTSQKPKRKFNSAGLILPCARVHNALKNKKYGKRVNKTASVFLTAILEYLVYEIFEGSLNESINMEKIRITPRAMRSAIKADKELNKMLKNVDLPFEGIVTTPATKNRKTGDLKSVG